MGSKTKTNPDFWIVIGSLFPSFLIGQSNNVNFSLGFTTLKWKPLYITY